MRVEGFLVKILCACRPVVKFLVQGRGSNQPAFLVVVVGFFYQDDGMGNRGADERAWLSRVDPVGPRLPALV